MLTVSVVIPTLNEEDYIGSILGDLCTQSYVPYEIIVVDCGSEDTTSEIVSSYNNVQLLSASRSVSAQRNAGAARASGDVVLFLDADTRISADFIQDMVTDFEKRKLHLACPLFVPINAQLFTYFIFWYCNFIFVLLQAVFPSGAGPCILVKRNIFLENDGFKEDQSFEDMEWVRRMGRKYDYGILFHRVYVSDRRFRTYGMFRMIVLYVILSFLFTLGLFGLANKVKYSFGGYAKNDRK